LPQLIGTRFWNEICDGYEVIDRGGVELLALACQSIDCLQAIEAEIEEEGLSSVNDKGVRVGNALNRDRTATAALVARLVKQLDATSGRATWPRSASLDGPR
jgi:hypothetical protein